jgi:hypothetical protein
MGAAISLNNQQELKSLQLRAKRISQRGWSATGARPLA